MARLSFPSTPKDERATTEVEVADVFNVCV